MIKLEGNPADPISQGAICARGQAALQGLYNPDRLRRAPEPRPDGSLDPVSWDDALKTVQRTTWRAAAKAGKDRVAFISGAAGPDAQTRSRSLWLGAYGSSRMVLWERLGDEPARAASKASFGRDDLPIYVSIRPKRSSRSARISSRPGARRSSIASPVRRLPHAQDSAADS